MIVQAIIKPDGIEISDYNKKRLHDLAVKEGGVVRGELSTLLPESSRMRRYVMGCLLPLAVYLDEKDYQDNEVCERYFEYYKKEFNPVAMRIGNKIELFGQSTKGSKALSNFAQKLQDYLHEQHGISYNNKAMSVDEYKKWRNTIMSFSTDTWIEYCKSLKYIE